MKAPLSRTRLNLVFCGDPLQRAGSDMRYWLRISTVISGALLALLSAVHRPAPASTLGDVVGIRGSRPFGGFCSWYARPTALGEIPTGQVFCAWYRREAQLRRAELDQVSYHALSRRVYRAERSWEPLSAQRWRSEVDSIRHAFQRQGGTRLCRRESRIGGERTEEVWHFPGFHVELFTGRDAGSPLGSGGAEPSRWHLFLRGERDLQYLCKHLEQPIVAGRTAAAGRSSDDRRV